MLTDTHKLAWAQCTRVGQYQPGRRLPDHTAGAQRDHQADQYRQALEGFRMSARQVRVGHCQSKQPDGQRGQARGGLQGFFVEPTENTRHGDTPQHAFAKATEAPSNEENRQHNTQPRHSVDHALEQ